MIKKWLYIPLLFICSFVAGQDIHFSQTARTNFLINPAFSGTFNGDFEATLNWKDQWQSINNTFRTYAASAAVSFGKGRARKPTFYSIGIFAAKDVAGDIQMGTTNAGLSFSSLFKLSRNQRFCIGATGAYVVTGINTSNMQWGSQYQGLNFDPSLSNGEGSEFLPFQFWDLGAGIAYWYHKNDRNVIFGAPQDAKIGFSVYHINRPKYAFGLENNEYLPMRVVFHASALLGSGEKGMYFYPNLTANFQGKQHEVVTGMLVKYILQSGSKMTGLSSDLSFSAGMTTRITNVFDAIIPQIFIDFSAFSVGMSYDINTSKLNQASKYRGGFELSLRFTNLDGYTHKNPYRRGVFI